MKLTDEQIDLFIDLTDEYEQTYYKLKEIADVISDRVTEVVILLYEAVGVKNAKMKFVENIDEDHHEYERNWRFAGGLVYCDLGFCCHTQKLKLASASYTKGFPLRFLTTEDDEIRRILKEQVYDDKMARKEDVRKRKEEIDKKIKKKEEVLAKLTEEERKILGH